MVSPVGRGGGGRPVSRIVLRVGVVVVSQVGGGSRRPCGGSGRWREGAHLGRDVGKELVSCGYPQGGLAALVLVAIADLAHETVTPSLASAIHRSRSAAPARSSSQPSIPTPSSRENR